jgi:DNA repair protein RadA/Sms
MAKRKRSKPKSRWVCSDCSGETTGWFGRCPACGAWNTIAEVAPEQDEADGRVRLATGTSRVVPANRAIAEASELPRLRTGIGELDRVLGGGLVAGSVVMLHGSPGVGKSTLLLQACAGLCAGGGSVLYASGEESIAQVGGRAQRLGTASERLLLIAETRIEAVLEAARERKPAVLVVDSIQTVYSDRQDGLPGNQSQIRTVTAQLLGFAKREGVPVVVVGHVTKDGQLAGPRLLEHMVDAVLSFEGDDEHALRLLRASKNRFGSTQELGVFEMQGDGLAEVDNPSLAFLGGTEAAIGACVTAAVEGSRPLLVEVQALLGPSPGGSPRRTCVGADGSRVAMLLAVMDRHAGLFVVDQDVFVNVAGGLRLREPVADLAVFLAIASSHLRKPVRGRTLALAEVGLTGELRPAPRLEVRLAEAARLGFTHAIACVRKDARVRAPKGLTITRVTTVSAAVAAAFEADG